MQAQYQRVPVFEMCPRVEGKKVHGGTGGLLESFEYTCWYMLLR